MFLAVFVSHDNACVLLFPLALSVRMVCDVFTRLECACRCPGVWLHCPFFKTKQYEKLVAAGVIRDDCPAFCAPLMDMLNHDRNAVVRVGLAPTTRQGQTVEESDRAPARPHGFLGISSSVDVAESEECMNNYGGRSNLQLLFGFGFCMRDNPNDEARAHCLRLHAGC